MVSRGVTDYADVLVLEEYGVVGLVLLVVGCGVRFSRLTYGHSEGWDWGLGDVVGRGLMMLVVRMTCRA